jgi:hypothetical protein
MVSEEKQRRWERNESKKKEKQRNCHGVGSGHPRLKNKSKFDVNELQLPVRLD